MKKGGTVALGGIHMSPIPPLDYNLLYYERVLRSVANNTRQDGEDFLRLAAEIPIHTEIEVFPLRDANRALNSLKNDAIRGAAVLEVSKEVDENMDRGREKRLNSNPPPSEPDWRISRIRLSSRWCYLRED